MFGGRLPRLGDFLRKGAEAWEAVSPLAMAGLIGAAGFADQTFTIYDGARPTAKVQFSADLAPLGATTVYTLPSAASYLAGSTAALISGRVPRATAGGLLIDDAGLTYGGLASPILTVGDGAGANSCIFRMNPPNGQTAELRFTENLLIRFNIQKNGSGSVLNFNAHDAAGVFIDTAFLITNAASGSITFGAGRPLTLSGNIVQSGATTHVTGTGTFTHNGPVTVASGNNVGISAAANSAAWLYVAGTNSAVTNVGQRAIYINTTHSATATSVKGVEVALTTVNTVFTLPLMRGFDAGVFTKGASATVTNVDGFHSAIQTVAASANVGFHYGNGTATAGTWGFYSSAASNNSFGTGQSIFPANGSAAAPTIQFSSAEVHGFYRISATAIGLAIAGAAALNLGSASILAQIASAGSYAIGSSVTDGGVVYMSGSSTSAGGQLRCWGSTHATKANYRELNRGATVDVTIDGSGNVWMAASSVVGGTTFVGSERLRIAGGSAATAGATDVLVGAGIIDMGVSLRYRGSQVISAPKTGYTNLMTGAANRATAYDTATITLVQLAERVKAMEDDLHLNAGAGHGLLAA